MDRLESSTWTAGEIRRLEAEIQNWKDREAAYCPDGMKFEKFIAALQQSHGEALKALDDAWWIELGKFRKALHEAGLHGHYNLLQQYFGETDAAIAEATPEGESK